MEGGGVGDLKSKIPLTPTQCALALSHQFVDGWMKETHVSPSLTIGELTLKEEDAFYCHIKAR